MAIVAPKLSTPPRMTFLLILWLGLGALILLGIRPILGGWGSPAIIVWPPYILLGLAFAAAALKASIRPGTPPQLRSFRPLLIFALGGGALFAVHPWLARYSDERVFRARLARSQPAYEALVAQLRTDSSYGPWHWGSNLRYLVDSGPPLRVAILQAGQAYDGAEVALYDSARSIGAGNRSSGTVQLSNGSLRDCILVHAPWFRCIVRLRTR